MYTIKTICSTQIGFRFCFTFFFFGLFDDTVEHFKSTWLDVVFFFTIIRVSWGECERMRVIKRKMENERDAWRKETRWFYDWHHIQYANNDFKFKCFNAELFSTYRARERERLSKKKMFDLSD